ncbi:MAG TPA: crotonase/enoyl-CoA hydratase family protein [Xanthobacteraceae bacterium]|jgi:enoyl-CoA hydratase/carnithine racemase|nr:crotonase/enoyl-CoA hydratase family protein [Xanthobacteraceae bacterium]
MSDQVLVTDDGGVRVIRMNRPEKKNALTQPMYTAMTAALDEAGTNDAIRCIVIAGTPGAFCAGSDIGDFQKRAEGGLEPVTIGFLHALARNQKPLVAAVGGIAVGIGTTMLLHCDHVVAATGVAFSTPFIRLGLIPEAASSLLAPQRMGHARAFALLVMGRPLPVEDAKAAGLVNTIVDAAAVDDTAMQAAREIETLPPGAVALARSLMRDNADTVTARIDSEAAHFQDRLKSDEARAAFAAFFARKK